MLNVDDVTLESEDGEGNTKSADNKLKDLRGELKKAKAERDEYLDALQRMKADYINAKRRFEEDKAALAQFASEAVVLELLPVVDALHGALQHKASEDGIKNIKSQFDKILASFGVEAYDPSGESFDPAKHEPVETLEVTKESEDNTVTRVHQRGYTLHGRVIRPARVAVGHYKK